MSTIVNLDEKIGKQIGRRKPPETALAAVMQTAEESRRWKQAFGTLRIPRGVYRFATHEESDEWMMKMLTRQANR